MSKKNDIVVDVTGLKKTYHADGSKVDVLKGITLQIPRGEIVIVMGPSGVGKSTLLNLIGTLDTPTSGKVLINGEDVFGYKERKIARFRNRHIGFVFQFRHLLPDFTALENVMLPYMIKSNETKSERERAVQLLTDVGMQHRLEHRPNQLSGGEQQRVAIARAFMNQPQLILADEPTGDLDRKNSQGLFELILELNRKYQQTFIIVTHDEMFAEQSHRTITLAEGRVAEERVINSL